MKTKLDPKDAALVAFIETIDNLDGVTELTPEESAANYGAEYGCTADPEWTDLASAYLLACKATGTEPTIQRLPKRTCPVAHVEIVLRRSSSDDDPEEETAYVHELASKLPEEVKLVRVVDVDGNFLYYGDAREGEED